MPGRTLRRVRVSGCRTGRLACRASTFTGEGCSFRSPSFRAVRLGNDGGDLKFRRAQQGAQTGRGQFRCAHENDSQRHPLERNGKPPGKKAEKDSTAEGNEGNQVKQSCPQITQMSAEEVRKNNLRPSAKSADASRPSPHASKYPPAPSLASGRRRCDGGVSSRNNSAGAWFLSRRFSSAV